MSLELPSKVSGDRQDHTVPELLSDDMLLHSYLIAILTLDHAVPDAKPVEPWMLKK